MIERVLADYRRAYGFGSFRLRYFNAAGADPPATSVSCVTWKHISSHAP